MKRRKRDCTICLGYFDGSSGIRTVKTFENDLEYGDLVRRANQHDMIEKIRKTQRKKNPLGMFIGYGRG